MSFSVDVKKQKDGVYLIRPEGRLDSTTYPMFKEGVMPLLDKPVKALIFDMDKLDYISSAGIGVIFQARKVVEAEGGVFIMTNLKPQIKKVFEIVKLLPKDAVFKSLQEVDSYLDAIQRKESEKEEK
ncbi:MAG: STAS domain-containing protein [Candidatus Omnitrophota bacterium]